MLLINKSGQLQNQESCTAYTFDKTCYYVNGFIFTSGKKAGAETINWLNECLRESDEIPFDSLMGAFSLFIVFPDGRITAFTDNSGQHAIYIHDKAISDSLLDLIDYLTTDERLNLKFSSEALAESYSLGRVFCGKTLIQGITLSDSFQQYTVANGMLSEGKKPIINIDCGAPDFSPDVFFTDLAYALTGFPVSVALTGGYDSRMVYAFLRNRRKVTPSLSGDCMTEPDIVTAKKVAQSVDDRLNLIETKKPDISAALLQRIFNGNDGECDLVSPSTYRLSQFYEKLSAQGFCVHITGDGGVLHKDWEWMQDLPFYNKKHTNMERFYHQRLAYLKNTSYAGPSIKNEIAGMKGKILAYIEQYRRESNTKSYDMLYYYVNGRRECQYNIQPSGVIQYAPLLEKRFVAYSYVLPRRKRFFYNNMRRLTTMQNETIAKIPTCYGTTASSEAICIIRDIFMQCIDYFKKFIRMIGRKYLKKNLFVSAVTTWKVREELNAEPISQAAVQFCVEQGYINEEARVGDLSDAQLAFAIRVFMLQERINAKHKPE